MLGYARLKRVDSAMKTVKRFHAAGGVPDVAMLDVLVELCIREGDLQTATQVPLDRCRHLPHGVRRQGCWAQHPCHHTTPRSKCVRPT